MSDFHFADNDCAQHRHRSSHQRDQQSLGGGRQQLRDLCQPACDVKHSECVGDFGLEKNTYSCRCLPGFEPTYLPAPLLSSAGPKLVFCNPTMTNGTAVEPGLTVDSASKNFTIKY